MDRIDISSTLPSPLFFGSYPNSSDAAKEIAEQLGLDIVKGSPRVLQLDIDGHAQLLKAHIALSAAVESHMIGIDDVRYTVSRSGGAHWHLYVYLTEPIESPTQRCLYQAMLGSDNVREIQGWFRSQKGDDTPTLFWELPNSALWPYSKLYDEVIHGLEKEWKQGIQNKPEHKNKVKGKTRKAMMK